MTPFLIAVELIALVVAGAWLFRRVVPSKPPFDRPLGVLALLLLAQAAVAAGGVSFIVSTGDAPAVVASAIQALRAGLLLCAAACWLSIVRAASFPVWRRVLLVVWLVAAGIGPAALGLPGHIAVVLVLAGLPWPRELHGWRRLAGLLVALPLTVLMSVEPVAVVRNDTIDLTISAGSWSELLTGDLPPAVVSGFGAAKPFDWALGVGLVLFRCQLAVAFYRFLFLPVGLRSFSLKRRFWFNYLLTRSVPWVLSSILFFALIYAGFGLHKASQVRRRWTGRSIARSSAGRSGDRRHQQSVLAMKQRSGSGAERGPRDVGPAPPPRSSLGVRSRRRRHRPFERPEGRGADDRVEGRLTSSRAARDRPFIRRVAEVGASR